MFNSGEFGEPTRFEQAMLSGDKGLEGMDGSGDDPEFKQLLEELANKAIDKDEKKDEK